MKIDNRLLKLKDFISEMESLLIFGARGTGKTYLCMHALNKMNRPFIVSLLRPGEFQRYLRSPELLEKEVLEYIKDKKKGYVFIDEIQKVPALLDVVHKLLFELDGKISFILTGSSARKLKRGSANLLAARAMTRHLYPLTPWEADLDLKQVLQMGSLPQVYLKPKFAKTRLRSYVLSYLKEEIQLEALTRKIDSFSRFLDVAGQMNGEPINYSEISKDSGISSPTVQEYFSILVDTLLAHKLPGWERSVRKQLLHAPKYYFFDCGVLNAIRGELTSELKSSGYRAGKLFETWIVQQMFRLNDYTESDFLFHYWRTNSGSEVDIIISRANGNAIYAIEIKSTERPTEDNISSLLSFATENKDAKLICLCQTMRPYNLNGVEILPWKEGLERIFELK